MNNPYLRLHDGMLANAIDESLHVKPNRNFGITMQSIVNARKYIQGEEFKLLYKIVYKVDPTNLIKWLKRMWVELCRDESRSPEFRAYFKPEVGRPGSPKTNHPKEWCYTHNRFGAFEKWEETNEA